MGLRTHLYAVSFGAKFWLKGCQFHVLPDDWPLCTKKIVQGGHLSFDVDIHAALHIADEDAVFDKLFHLFK